MRSARPVPGFSFSRSRWLVAVEEFLRDGTGTALAHELRVTERSAYKVVHAIQDAMASDDIATLSGTIEADATFLGGEWANKRVHIRAKGTKRGRGTKKQCVFGVVERGGLVIVWDIRSECRTEVEPRIESVVRKGSRICTDECGAYFHLSKTGYVHESVNHHQGEYVRGDVHTQTLDGYWGLLKNFLGAKGGVRPKNLMRFVREHSWRYNNRGLSRKEQALKIYALLTRIGGI